jgi:hypothetical protein
LSVSLDNCKIINVLLASFLRLIDLHHLVATDLSDPNLHAARVVLDALDLVIYFQIHPCRVQFRLLQVLDALRLQPIKSVLVLLVDEARVARRENKVVVVLEVLRQQVAAKEFFVASVDVADVAGRLAEMLAGVVSFKGHHGATRVVALEDVALVEVTLLVAI